MVRQQITALATSLCSLMLLSSALPAQAAPSSPSWADHVETRDGEARALRQAPGTLVFSTSDRQFDRGVDNQGWWSRTLGNADDNDNYFIGRCSDCNGGVLRNFFTFYLGRLRPESRVIAATLVLQRYEGEGAPKEPLGLFDVSTAATTQCQQWY